MTDEVWKDIPGWEGYYQASSFGNIRSVDRAIFRESGQVLLVGKILHQVPHIHTRYKFVGLQRSGIKHKTCKVHILVAKTFLGECPIGMNVCHGDGNRHNNELSNLRYDTRSNNEREKEIHGTSNHGDRNGCSKLKNLEVALIKRLLNHNVNRSVLCKMFKIGCMAISSISTGRNWKSVQAI